MCRLAGAFLVVAAALVVAADGGDEFRLAGTVIHPPISEMSGIAKSRTYENTWWVHNDSGDSARIFAIDAGGTPIVPPFLSGKYVAGPTEDGVGEWPGNEIHLAANLDWEDIVLADGKLYVADMGNNGNCRRDLGVYVVNEPNPRQTKSMRVLRHLPIRYPEQRKFPPREWHYDCEAVFHSDGNLYFLTKHRVAGQVNRGEPGTRLYRLDTEHTDRENVLTFLQSRDDLILPTAADLSPDGNRLAVLTVVSLWVFEKPDSGDRWLNGDARKIQLPRDRTLQAEGVTWDDDTTIRICNEQGDIFTILLEK